MSEKLPADWREQMVKYMQERKRKGLIPKYVTEVADPRRKKEKKK